MKDKEKEITTGDETKTQNKKLITIFTVTVCVLVTVIIILTIKLSGSKSSGGMGGFPGGGFPGGAPSGMQGGPGGSSGKSAQGGQTPGAAVEHGGQTPNALEAAHDGEETAKDGEAPSGAPSGAPTGAPGGTMPSGFGGFSGFGSSSNSSATSVRAQKAVLTDLIDYVTTTGDVQTQTSIEVFPSIGGTVVQINATLGSQVQKGDVIGYVDPSEPGSYYSKSPITAPISGSILTSPVRTGQKVNVSSVITKIGDTDNLQISAKIPERYVADLEIGEKAEITVEAYPDVKFIASVVRISPVVDSSTRTKEIILNFDETDSRINAGMFAKVKLYTRTYGGKITVPQDAIVNNSDKYYLYVVNKDGQTVTKREVTLGKNIDGYYQILTGVNVGETVVTEGTLTLYEGAAVKVIN